MEFEFRDQLPKPQCSEALQVFVEHEKRPGKKELERKARVQQDPTMVEKASYTQGTEDFNIWYGMAPSPIVDHLNRDARPPAVTRCNPFTDSGWTKATVEEERDPKATIPVCIYFAKGCCTYGSSCKFHHRVPTAEDDVLLSSTSDVFGRNRHASHREDMMGVGSFQTDCRNLLVGNLTLDRSDSNFERNCVNTLFKHFGIMGPVENIRLIVNRSMAIVTFALRCSAEFAKVALSEQNIGAAGKQVSIKWAHPDKNARQRDEQEETEFVHLEKQVHKRMQELNLPEDTLLKYKEQFSSEAHSGLAAIRDVNSRFKNAVKKGTPVPYGDSGPLTKEAAAAAEASAIADQLEKEAVSEGARIKSRMQATLRATRGVDYEVDI